MTSQYGATYEDDIVRFVREIVEKEEGIREDHAIKAVAERMNLDKEDVDDMIEWLVAENIITRRGSSFGGNRLYKGTFGLRRVLPPGVENV